MIEVLIGVVTAITVVGGIGIIAALVEMTRSQRY
ncbi:MAG: hypothetical protein RI885_656 [Actinomycetota bacterium]